MTRQLVFFLTVLLIGCTSASDQAKNQARTDTLANENKLDSSNKILSLPDSLTKIIGDFNGDGKKDSAKVLLPQTDNYGNCEKCITKISFTNSVDTLTIPYVSIGAIIYNVGDLDGNKTDELLVIPDWNNSCLGLQWVYTFKTNKWDTIASGQIYRCSPCNTIKKIKNKVFTMIETSASEPFTTIKPFIGFYWAGFSVTYGYNFHAKTSISEINTHQFAVRYYLPVKKWKAKP